MTPSQPRTRRTRIVCISDTHNQTPRLPPGDVLIHAGDLTNQGSYSELQRAVAWLERQEFEAKIVVAGNHEITLDAPFFYAHGSSRKWPAPQDPEACRKLFTQSPSITYLEHECVDVYLTSPTGPRTSFRVFGSPYSFGVRGWAFQYDEADKGIWNEIPLDADIVVTHTPALGLCDTTSQDVRAGCAGLLQRLAQVRPLVSVCGHIHEARGAARVQWGTPSDSEAVRPPSPWTDPGCGTKKLSLVDLTQRTGRVLVNGAGADLTRQRMPDWLVQVPRGEPREGLEKADIQSLVDTASPESEARWVVKAGGAVERRTDVGVGVQADYAPRPRAEGSETAVINASFLGPRVDRRTGAANKPIVVDVELPVWSANEAM